MHTCNLGLYMVLNAEGILILSEHHSVQATCTLQESVSHQYDLFRSWCKQHKIQTSQRRWRLSQLHLTNSYGVCQFPWLCHKAFNGRVILAWLADLHILFKNMVSYLCLSF